METIEETPVLTTHGVFQTVRKYDYENGKVIIERTFNGRVVSVETFDID